MIGGRKEDRSGAQLIGARVIGAFYGVSLFVWTSLIAVTLLALAAGYAAGGRYADRMRTPDAIFAWLAAAGACVLAVPWLKSGVLAATAPLGPRWGAFASALFARRVSNPACCRLTAISSRIAGSSSTMAMVRPGRNSRTGITTVTPAAAHAAVISVMFDTEIVQYR